MKVAQRTRHRHFVPVQHLSYTEPTNFQLFKLWLTSIGLAAFVLFVASVTINEGFHGRTSSAVGPVSPHAGDEIAIVASAIAGLIVLAGTYSVFQSAYKRYRNRRAKSSPTDLSGK